MSYYKDDNGFIVYNVSKAELDSANAIVDKEFTSSFNLNSKTVHNRRTSRVAGILGEIVFKNYYGDLTTQSPRGEYPYDFTMAGGLHVDVKCKCRNVTPKPTFEASVYTYQLTKYFDVVDYYVFMSTMPDFSKVWFCGYIGKDEWKNNPNGKLWLEGETDKSNGLLIKKDTWSVYYQYLRKFKLI